MTPTNSQPTAVDDKLTIDEIAARYKVTSFGQTGEAFGIECIDVKCIPNTLSVLVDRIGGLGLDLAEMQSLKGRAGLVLIADIAPGSTLSPSYKAHHFSFRLQALMQIKPEGSASGMHCYLSQMLRTRQTLKSYRV